MASGRHRCAAGDSSSLSSGCWNFARLVGFDVAVDDGGKLSFQSPESSSFGDELSVLVVYPNEASQGFAVPFVGFSFPLAIGAGWFVAADSAQRDEV